MLTIMHLSTGLNVGGAETLLRSLVTSSDSSRFRHVVVSLIEPGRIGEELAQHDVPVHTLAMDRGRPTPWGVWRLMRLLRWERPHVLQTWMYHADLMGTLPRMLHRRPALVWTLHAAGLDMSMYRRLSGWTRRACASLSAVPDAVVANSPVTRAEHESLGYRPRRWLTIANGVDADAFRPNPAVRTEVLNELRLPAGTRLIGYVARYDPVKDHDTFLRAASVLAATCPDVHFVLAGAGASPDNPGLAAKVDALGLTARVHLLGLRSDMTRIQAALDVATSCSASEGFSNSIAEAMACGVTPVVTRGGNLPDLIDNESLVVPVHDADALARVWREVLALPHQRLRDLGLGMRQRVREDFSLASLVQQYQDLWLCFA